MGSRMHKQCVGGYVVHLGLEKKLLVSCNGAKKRYDWKIKTLLLEYFFLPKKNVSCMFYVDWELKGWKKLSDRDFSE